MPDAATASEQRFTVRHLNEADFKTGGLRGYSAYRDLGITRSSSRWPTC